MKNDQRNMGIRTLSGAVIIITVALAALLSSYTFALLSVVIALISSYELLTISKKGEYEPQTAVALIFTALITLLNSALLEFLPFQEAMSRVGLSSLFILPLMAVIVLFIELCRDKSKPLANSAITLFTVIYIGVPMSLVCSIPRFMSGGEWSGAIMLGYFFLLWANDSFAYLFGVTMGKRPLMKRISPKKSIEGFIGGVLGALVISIIAALILRGNIFIWGGLSIIVSLSAVVGDLVESMIKRSVNEKDSGSIIPGHGGFWDRFDSLIYSVPPVIIYLYLLTLLNLI